ncbi:MAG: hypothetical protein RIA65_07090 [Woeseia sp.]
MFPIADFSRKPRVFQFDGSRSRVDLGHCSGYWNLFDGRKCISEHSADRFGNIYETYFFSSAGLEDQSSDALFEHVKAAHTAYEHDPDISATSAIVIDSLDQSCWAIDVCIASATRLFRKRPPHFQFYGLPTIPIAPVWGLIERYREAQKASIPFILVAGETGSASWGDSDTYSLIYLKSEAELEARLAEYPSHMPTADYCQFNLGIIDARDKQQPFNEAVYCLAADWDRAEVSG